MANRPQEQVFVHPERYSIYRFPPDAPIPPGALGGRFGAITRTPWELSIVDLEGRFADAEAAQPGWRALSLAGPLAFELVGVLARLSQVLAGADVSVFAISTYDTDWILVEEEALPRAVHALEAAEYQVSVAPTVARRPTGEP